LALLSLALVLPATASARPKPAAADPYKVLVVTSGTDALSSAGIDAITQAVGSAGTVTAPAPADVGAQFTPANLDSYRAVVFLNTGMASPLTDVQRTAFENYFHKGGGFVGIGSAVETDPNWKFLTDILGTRSSGQAGMQSGTVKVFDRVHDATKNLPEYWDRTENWYNFSTNVRGVSHVLATVVEDPFSAQPAGNTLDGIAGGTMGANHPISFCKDFMGGRAFYTGLGTSASSFDPQLREHLKGAIAWAAGQSDPTYSDCGATVLRNYQQVKVTQQPNINEPIGFDQLPDGRIIQTDRRGGVRLHNPATGTTTIIANLGDTSLPPTLQVYTNSEDGLYGPAIDPNFAQNHWVYLYYAPQRVTNVKLSDGTIVDQTTPNTAVPNFASSPKAWDPYVGYFQLSRFKFVEDATGPHLDLSSEQQILRVSNNRQECCHVAGDIDFDKHGNLWMVTGDDTPAGGIRANGFGPFEDELTDEQQTVRVANATGGTFTLTFNGQTTAPLAFNATAAQVDAALEALSTVGANNIQTSGGPLNAVNAQNQPTPVNVFFRRALAGTDQPQITANGAGLTGNSPTVTAGMAVLANGALGNTPADGGMYQRPTGDDRRSTTNTNDLRGKILRINVKDAISSADFNKADTGSGSGAYTIPAGNLRDYAKANYPAVANQANYDAKFRPEIYAMGFRNPFRIQVDENDVAYISDYSPDSNTPQRGRGPSGVGRFEIVRKPSNYGYPLCYSSTLGYNRWIFQEFAPGTTTVGVPRDNPPANDCGNPAGLPNESRWVRDGGPAFEPGLALTPPVSDPEIWYSYRDNNATAPLGTPCAAYYAVTPGPTAPGSTTECPRLFPELYTGGVAPHGIAKYHYDPSNPNTKKFPPYYDNSVFLGEFGQDTLRELKLDSQNRVFKINGLLDCGQANTANSPFDFECDNPMDMQFGSDGDFYLLTYGDGFFNINPDAGMYKWEYVKGTQAPKAALSSDRTDGALPLTVQFIGHNSSDRDQGDSLKFAWDFGDGAPISEEVDPTHVYTKAGRYTAILKVTDSTDQTSTLSTIITVGNTSPTVNVTGPLDGGLFTFGDKIMYKVTVTDPEDPSVSCNDVTVTFVLGHDTHGHAEQSQQGCLGILQSIAEDVSHGGNVFGVISATYTDKGGRGANSAAPPLTTTTQVQIRQKHQEVENVVTQSGTNTATNTDGGVPGVHRSSITQGDWIQLNGPFNLFQIGTVAFRYAEGTAQPAAGAPYAAVDLRQDSITGPVVATANLPSTGGIANWQTVTVPVAMTGKHELFLTFRQLASGNTINNLVNLNWVEFAGNGVTVQQTATNGDAGGSVPATLALSLGTPQAFGAFTPGIEKTYDASMTANVISTAGDATLSVVDPSSNNPGHLVNAKGTGSAFAPVGSSPLNILTYGGPASNDTATIAFQQAIGRTDALRTGAYSKTLTFTLSTTTP
jgi:PKD repeat protein